MSNINPALLPETTGEHAGKILVDNLREQLTTARDEVTALENAMGNKISQQQADERYPLLVAGKVASSQLPSTDEIIEGASNLYFSAARVRNAVLSGLSLASAAAVEATDTVLAAIGKLQAQLANKQNALVSGDNIKTINGESIIGSGNIEISGGGLAPTVVDLGDVAGAVDIDMSANVAYQLNATANIALNLTNPPASGNFIPVTLMMTRSSGSGATVSFAQTVNWLGGSNPPVLADVLTATASIVSADGGVTYFGQVNGLSYQNQASGESTTWNPSDKSLGLVLSQGDTTVEMTTSQATPATGRAFGVKTTGKHKFVVVCVGSMGAGSDSTRSLSAIGLTNLAHPLNVLIGQTSYSHAVYCRAGYSSGSASRVNKYTNAVETLLWAGAFSNGDIYTFLVDFDLGYTWVAKEATMLGGGDPNAGSTPMFTFAPNSPLAPAISLAEHHSGNSAGIYKLLNEIEDPYAETWPSFAYWTA